MKKHLKGRGHSVPVPPQADTDVAGLIIKMQQQLVFLEKKIDTLIGRPPERPVEAKHHFKPFQRFDHSHRQGEARQDNNYRERVLHKAICADCNKECEVPFKPSQDRPVYCKECFSKRKSGGSFRANNDNRPRDNRPRVEEPPKEEPFYKHHLGENRKPYGKRRVSKKRKK